MMLGEPLTLDYPELDKLEEKIVKIINIVERLYSENKELKQINEDLLQKNKEQLDTITALKEKCYNLQNIEDSTRIYREREDNIRIKIQQMLKKLENFQ